MTDFVRQIVREALNEGYWGHMPEDGDYPSDLMYDIDGAVNKTLKDKTFKKKKRKKPKNQDKWAQIGVMNNLFKKGGWLEKKYIKICLDYLKSLKDDDEWQKEWTEPKTVNYPPTPEAMGWASEVNTLTNVNSSS